MGAIFDRDPGVIRRFENDYLLLERYSSGSNRGHGCDIDTRLDRSSIHFVDMSRPYRTRTTTAECQSVVIPHQVIGGDPSRDERYVSLIRASGRGAVLDAALSAMFEAQACGASDDAEALADSFAGLVQRLVLGHHQRNDADAPSRGARLLAQRHVAQRIHDLELHPDRLCAAPGLSHASPYRSFAPHGGVIRYINDLRLDRCFGELRRGPRRRGRVREVAEKWGFFESANFNRRFRERYGISPSECMDEPAAGDAGRLTAHPAHERLRRP